MLPLLRDQLRVALCPDKVVTVRISKGLRPQVEDKHIFRCAEGVGGLAWESPLATLKEIAGNWNWRKSDVTVILSNHFVRYAVIPWTDKLGSQRELAALVNFYFEKTYGGVVADWDLRVSPSSMGKSSLASGIDKSLVDRLRETFGGANLKLRSIQPYLMASVNNWHKAIDVQSRWFVLAEPNRVCVAHLQNNEWRSVRTRQVSEDLSIAVPRILEQEALSSDVSEVGGAGFLFAYHMPNFSLPSQRGWALQTLKVAAQPGFSPYEDASYAIAMVGAA